MVPGNASRVTLKGIIQSLNLSDEDINKAKIIEGFLSELRQSSEMVIPPFLVPHRSRVNLV